MSAMVDLTAFVTDLAPETNGSIGVLVWKISFWLLTSYFWLIQMGRHKSSCPRELRKSATMITRHSARSPRLPISLAIPSSPAKSPSPVAVGSKSFATRSNLRRRKLRQMSKIRSRSTHLALLVICAKRMLETQRSMLLATSPAK